MSEQDFVLTSGIYVPVIKKFYMYIDDGGSRNENLIGFSVIILDQYAASDLIERIKHVAEKYGIDEFHAISINLSNVAQYDHAYDELIEAFANSLLKANLRFCSSRFGPNIEHDANFQTIKHFYDDLLQQEGASALSRLKLLNPAAYLTLPLVELANAVNLTMHPNVSLDLIIDRTSNYDELCSLKFSFPGKKLGHVTYFIDIIKLLVNAYMKKVIRSSLQLSSAKISKPEVHVILQINDAISNFSLNFMRYLINPSAAASQIKTLKKDKFEKLLKDCGLSATDIQDIKTRISANWHLSGSSIVSTSRQSVSLFRIV